MSVRAKSDFKVSGFDNISVSARKNLWNYSKTKKTKLYADAACSGYSDGSLDLFGGIAGWFGGGGVGGGYPTKSMRQV